MATEVLNMLLILVLVSTALSSPIEWDAKDPKLRSLLESGGPADTTGSWTPDYTPEVKAALKFFIDSYNTVELGGLELLQAQQIPNAYIANTPRWSRSTMTARRGRSLAPSLTTLRLLSRRR